MYFIYIYIYGEKDNDVIFLDSNLKFVGKAPRYCRASYEDYLFDYDKNALVCYKLSDKQWEYTHSDDSNIQIISGYKDKVLLYSENGDLFALNLQTGSVEWEYPYPEKYYTANSLNGDYLYTSNQNDLIEIDAETGKITRTMDIKSIQTKEKFLLSRIKAYDDYIFCTDTFGGTVAIIDRKTLELSEVFRFENRLINRDYALQWLNNRLYVQDVEHIIHIFE